MHSWHEYTFRSHSNIITELGKGKKKQHDSGYDDEGGSILSAISGFRFAFLEHNELFRGY